VARHDGGLPRFYGSFLQRKFIMTRINVAAVTVIVAAFVCTAAAQRTTAPATQQTSRAPLNPALPSLFVVGDSTASNGPRNGWGDPLADYFDATKINARNRALGGRSSRSFQTEGHWAAVLKEMKAGDYVLLQMGQNDGGSQDTGRARGSLPGIGEETKEVLMPESGEIEPPPPGTKEVVHTFGWYIRKYVTDAKARGVTPIVMSLTAKDLWTPEGKNRRPYDKFPEWSEQIAREQGVQFLDLINIMGDQFDKMGQEKAHALFQDTTHTKEAGADLNAAGVIAGLKALKSPLVEYLSDKGRAVEAYHPGAR
jgi:lysophospholipase L1-like esterase